MTSLTVLLIFIFLVLNILFGYYIRKTREQILESRKNIIEESEKVGLEISSIKFSWIKFSWIVQYKKQ